MFGWTGRFLHVNLSKGKKLSRVKYDRMLQTCYRKRGWNEQGVPRKSTLKTLGLEDVVGPLEHCVNMSARSLKMWLFTF